MIRVLHVVENFNGQAVESWLTRLVNYKGFDSNLLHFDFFLLGIGPGRLSDSVLEKGCKLHEGNPGGASILQMARSLRREVKQGGYDVVHVHQDVMGGIFAVALLGLPVRLITHAHNCWQRLPVGGFWKEKILTSVARFLVLRLSKVVVGVSSPALLKMTGGHLRAGRIDRVIYCGVDATRFLNRRTNRNAFRRSIGLPEQSNILLFVGRLVPDKNPEFVLAVLQEIRKLEPQAVGVFVGKGSEEKCLMSRAAELKLDKATRFLGWRTDIPDIMCCSDWFIHSGPESPMEGFGLVALEAQLAGLKLLLSKGIPDDALLGGSCFRQLSVNEPARIWAREACELLNDSHPTRETAAAALELTKMAQNTAFDEMLELYLE